MIQRVCNDVEVFSLNREADIVPAVDALINGSITLLRLGSMYSFVLNPNVEGLAEAFALLKERESGQSMSAVCTYEMARRIVDKKRVNADFYHLSAEICGKVIVRIPIDTTLPVPHSLREGTMQFLDFSRVHPMRSAFTAAIAARGCEYLAITSGNVHGAPVVEDLTSATMLAAVFNLKASLLGIPNVQTVVTDIPTEAGAHRGSLVILSFCNPQAIEVKRLANKSDREFTESYVEALLADVPVQTPLVYTL